MEWDKKMVEKMALIPAKEHLIPSIEAEPWFSVDRTRATKLEGLCFDKNDNLFFVDIEYDILYKLEMKTKKLSVVCEYPGKKFASVKVHKDGRLFVCCLAKGCGMFTINPDGSGYKEIEILKDFAVDDLVFDSKGGFYFTHLVGECVSPLGGVYYVDPDLNTVYPVVTRLSAPNGVALSNDEEILWITETTGGRLLRIELTEDGKGIAPYGSYPAYHFVGRPGPDSCMVDSEDNLYVALYQQGRFMIFNENGYPIGQVLLPGREKGLNLNSTHCKLRPGTNELYMCSSSNDAENGAWIFKAVGIAAASTKDYQLQL